MFNVLDAIFNGVLTASPRDPNGWFVTMMGAGLLWYAGLGIVYGPLDRIALIGAAVFVAGAALLGMRVWQQTKRRAKSGTGQFQDPAA